jgi:hypothetical protein
MTEFRKKLRRKIRKSLDLKGVFNKWAIAEIVDNLDRDFVLIPRADLPDVTRETVGKFDYVTTGDGGWSFGLGEEDAPSATDPAHLVAVIEWFRDNGIKLNGEGNNG